MILYISSMIGSCIGYMIGWFLVDYITFKINEPTPWNIFVYLKKCREVKDDKYE